MRTMQTALPAGPYDWNPDLVPAAEFEGRVAALQALAARHGLAGVLLHGNAGEGGAVAYISGYTPVMGRAILYVPVAGEPKLAFAGGQTSMPYHTRLTWLKDVRPYKDLKRTLPEMFAPLPAGAAIGQCGDGALTSAFDAQLREAFAGRIVPLDDELDALRGRKSAHERGLIKHACTLLNGAIDAMKQARQGGAGARAASIAAEGAAYAAGAQDIQVLASARDGGPPLPFDDDADLVIDPLLACIAVRHAGYWAEGLVTLTSKPGKAQACAMAALSAAVAASGPGIEAGALIAVAEAKLAPCKIYPLSPPGIGNAIGTALTEAPMLDRSGGRLEAGGVYSLRIGAQGEGSDAAIVSAMIAVEATGTEILWHST